MYCISTSHNARSTSKVPLLNALGVFNEDSSDDLRFPDGSQLAFTDQDELTNEFVFPFGESCKALVICSYLNVLL